LRFRHTFSLQPGHNVLLVFLSFRNVGGKNLNDLNPEVPKIVTIHGITTPVLPQPTEL